MCSCSGVLCRLALAVQHFNVRLAKFEIESGYCMQEVISCLPKEHVAKKVADVTFSKLEFKNPSNMVCSSCH